MKYNLYAVQDVIIGFGVPFVKCNDQHAIRDYLNDLKSNPHAEDMRLFKVGQFNDETGELEGCIPECLQGGGVNERCEN